MEDWICDAAVFCKRTRNEFSSLCTIYFDVTPYAGDLKYSQLTKLTENKFRGKPGEWNSIQYAEVARKPILDSSYTK